MKLGAVGQRDGNYGQVSGDGIERACDYGATGCGVERKGEATQSCRVSIASAGCFVPVMNQLGRRLCEALDSAGGDGGGHLDQAQLTGAVCGSIVRELREVEGGQGHVE